MTKPDVYGQDVANEVHARRAVQFRHQHGRFRQLHAAHNSINQFASAESACERTEFRVGMKSTECLRDLKRDLKTDAVLGQATPDG